MENRKVFLIYVPVIHLGYVNVIRKKLEQGFLIYLIDHDGLSSLDYVRKDLRVMKVRDVFLGLSAIFEYQKYAIDIFSPTEFARFQIETLVGLDDEVVHYVVDTYLKRDCTYVDNFLRYDSKRTLATADVFPDAHTTDDVVVKTIMSEVEAVGYKSADWWRQVGAAVVREGRIILIAFNKHVPDHTVDFQGDPRANFKKGLHFEITTAVHAEQLLFAAAVSTPSGISFLGADLYVSTFPCPPCANLISHSGIHSLYYRDGYTMLDGEGTLRSRGISLIHVKQ